MWQSAEMRVYFMGLLTLLWPLEPDVLVRGRIREGGDQGQGRLLDLGAHASNEPILPDRREDDAIVRIFWIW